MVLCHDCKHWDKESVNLYTGFDGECKLASSGWDAPLIAWDEIQTNNPYLLTRSTFGCICGERK